MWLNFYVFFIIIKQTLFLTKREGESWRAETEDHQKTKTELTVVEW